MASSNPFLVTYNRGSGVAHGIGTIFNAVEGDVTSDPIDVREMRWLTIEFTEAGAVNNRNADLTITQSVDNSTYDNFDMLISNATNTNVQNLVRIATINRAAAGTDTLYVDARGLAFIKIDLDVTDASTPVGDFTVKLFGKS